MSSLLSPDFLWRLIAFLIAIVLHELAHGLVAYALGDSTAKRAGRLTLNPVAHIDPLGLILLLFGPFGWAKPIPVNLSNLRGGRRLGIALVALAGPITNVLLALLSAWLLLYEVHNTGASPSSPLIKFLYISLQLNVVLAVFNIIPIPPLDGSKVLFSLIPTRWYRWYGKYEMYGPFILLFVMVTQIGVALIMPVERIVIGWMGFV